MMISTALSRPRTDEGGGSLAGSGGAEAGRGGGCGQWQVSKSSPIVNGKLHFEKEKEGGLHLYWKEPKWRIGTSTPRHGRRCTNTSHSDDCRHGCDASNPTE
jgi:hypothetical protein